MSKFGKALEQAERDRRGELSPSGPAQARPATPAGDLAPGDRGIDDRLVSLLAPSAFEAEQYRALRHAVEQAKKRSRLSVVAVTSPGIGDGKTTTAINLAGALAQAAGVRVLLVDADLRRPAIASRLGLRGLDGPMLADLVLDPRLSFDDVARALPPLHLTVIPTHAPSPNSYELFQAPRMGEILAEARARFDYVVLDTPPLVPVLDARVIGRWIDGYLIVVSCHGTSRHLLANALNAVEPEKVTGLVFNGHDELPAGSGYYQYSAPSRRARHSRPLTRLLGRHAPLSPSRSPS